jgi:hypothetical protein
LYQIKENYTYWLRFLASTFDADTVPEIFTVLNGRSRVDKQFINDVRAKILGVQERWVNSERACRKDQEVKRHSTVTTLRFINDKIPCIDNNRLNAVRDALNDVMLQTIVRVQREASLYPQILYQFDHVKADAKANGNIPAFVNVKVFKETWLSRVVHTVADSPDLKEYLKDWMLQRLLELKEIVLISKEWILTDETWLTRNLLGEIIVRYERYRETQSHNCLLTTQDVLKLIENDSGNKQLRIEESSLSDLLESIGACVRVNMNCHLDNGSTSLLFFPMTKALVGADYTNNIRPMVMEDQVNKIRQQIRRKFILRDCAFTTFPPGYFERLFSEIVSMEQKGKSYHVLRLDTYENAMILKCGDEEVFVRTAGDEFTITVSTLTEMADYVANISTFKSSAEIKLASICGIARRQSHPPIEEHCCHPSELESRPLVATIRNLDDPYMRKMFYGLTVLYKVELGMDKLSRSVRRVVTESAELCGPYSFVLTTEKIGQGCEAQISSSSSFIQFLRAIMSIRCPLLAGNSTSLPDTPSVLWLYLLDQSTMAPIVLSTENPNIDRYPIPIPRPNEFIENWLYLILSSLSEMEPVHGISGIAQLLGYPEIELHEFFELYRNSIYIAKVDDICRAFNQTSDNEKILKGFLKGFKLNDLKTFFAASSCSDIANICSLEPVVDDQDHRVWTAKGKSNNACHQSVINDSDQNYVVNTTSWKLELLSYIWKTVSCFVFPCHRAA